MLRISEEAGTLECSNSYFEIHCMQGGHLGYARFPTVSSMGVLSFCGAKRHPRRS